MISIRRILSAVILCSGAVTAAFSQTPSLPRTGTVAGVVADPTGAVIPGATIHVETHKPFSFSLPDRTADEMGNYSIALPPGTYDLTIAAAGFEPRMLTVTVERVGTVTRLNATLRIEMQTDQVSVFAGRNSNSAGDNKSAVVLGAAELAELSDNDATFQQQIQALAGANPMQPSGVYVDGFSGGAIPPKSSIREIRINSNPYSAQYDDLGFGRVEIFTKPGSDKLHGNVMAYSNDSALNTRNPFVGTQPPYYMLVLRGSVSGPIDKKTSFFANVTYNNQQNNSVINALATDTSSAPVNFAVASPTMSTDDSFRIDRQMAANNVFTARYEINHSSSTNAGLTALQTLPTEAYGSGSTTQTVQLSDSQNIGKNKILETRFQYIRSRTNQAPLSGAPTIAVEGYFNGGGSSSQTLHDNQDRTEFQEYFSLEHKDHFLHIGGRYRTFRDSNFSNANFNGTFTYSPGATGTPSAYANFQNKAPSQFTLTTGTASAVVLTGDLSVYAEDEWKVSKSVTIDYGFRAESQSAIPDHFDPAPRVGFAWAVGQAEKKQPIVTLRTGLGLFYDRFGLTQYGPSGPTYLLTSVRRASGTLERQYVIANPSAACVYSPTLAACNNGAAASAPTLYNVNPKLRSQYQVGTGLSAERTLGKHGSVTVTYLHLQGDHQWTSRNINAPLPDTYDPSVPASGVRPMGGTQNIYQFDSNGANETNTILANTQLSLSKRISAWAFTGNRVRHTNVSGPTGFPTNQYHLNDDYGRFGQPTFRFFGGGDIKLFYGITAEPFMAFFSRQPFNITAGSDLNGDTIYNDRPSFATAASPASAIYKTAYGTFDATPQPGEKIVPMNYANGPRYLYMEFALRKAFPLGPLPAAATAKPGADGKLPPQPPPPPRPYELSFSVEADNVLNHTNAGTPVGVLTSPQFGQSLSLNSGFNSAPNANRMISLAAFFSF